MSLFCSLLKKDEMVNLKSRLCLLLLTLLSSVYAQTGFPASGKCILDWYDDDPVVNRVTAKCTVIDGEAFEPPRSILGYPIRKVIVTGDSFFMNKTNPVLQYYVLHNFKSVRINTSFVPEITKIDLIGCVLDQGTFQGLFPKMTELGFDNSSSFLSTQELTMPNLETFEFKKSDAVQNIDFKGTFRNLTKLRVKDMPKLRSLTIESQGIPKLKTLEVFDAPLLTSRNLRLNGIFEKTEFLAVAGTGVSEALIDLPKLKIQFPKLIHIFATKTKIGKIVIDCGPTTLKIWEAENTLASTVEVVTDISSCMRNLTALIAGTARSEMSSSNKGLTCNCNLIQAYDKVTKNRGPFMQVDFGDCASPSSMSFVEYKQHMMNNTCPKTNGTGKARPVFTWKVLQITILFLVYLINE